MKIDKKKSHENHPRSASDAVSLDPAFLLTFPVLTFPQTKDHMCRATWYVHPQASYYLDDGYVTGKHFTGIFIPTHC